MSSTSQRLHYERQAHVFRTKNEKLEKLCRALQQERNQLQDQVRKVSAFQLFFCAAHAYVYTCTITCLLCGIYILVCTCSFPRFELMSMHILCIQMESERDDSTCEVKGHSETPPSELDADRSDSLTHVTSHTSPSPSHNHHVTPSQHSVCEGEGPTEQLHKE